ncbi:EH domain-containing protein 1 [Pongo pygmaeus]|uniref:EH domain-containing protein 1 n=17 Tax=Catarrhini TaxID=9526 RepID=A0A024R571_HUMAN|nr:EH domain-containing protein 1 isoform 2 [Homo sapiens]XP_008952265.1 EH domain-containing protein 1 isoform X1 [Pan paniscus]XP_009183963.1 EH domain-containing protein 1 isoform X3 [Papio anubis]XP_011719012.1 EH domain-containing protein 1 isoform X1 [Macaca nemestrina]XP_011797945.1 PREDICTED: EH domain-containing protein 1 isoform X1 [Colobus angolensis palliatus]XP_011848909.1 PREDICTED: EH domain-containing protein 1 isoform X1 [Mandrillus leucophaeus]XP_014969249.1 EH domain-contai|eukprot:NP_001269374.1 EH domain-containing protein 1 isoform 2 [Homo sapiens]
MEQPGTAASPVSGSMFSWVSKDARRKKEPELFQTVAEGLRQLYAQKLLPLEEHYRFHEFHSPALEDADFDNKPMVLLVGQYSTGKTTFIRHLIEQDFPGMRIGPEPTTDSFIAVMHGPTEGVVPGNALVVDPRRPFRKLNAFGNAFLNRFMCAQLPNPVLDSISIIDTPGILSGEKQRISRGYDFAAVLEWFAERVDRIILLFDAHKLDISDEFSEVIKALKNHEDKIRVVLNKADQIETQQLMRVYGALMWSLGKIINTPEVVRVYIGSFWSHPLLIPDNRKLFEAEEQDLFKDIQSLPRNAALRKLNDLIKRARLAKVHAYIISSLKKEMPNVFGKESKKKELVNNLGEIYQKIEREHQISPGDFPSLRKMQELLQTQDFSKFQALKPKLLDTVDDMLANDIARLMVMVRQEESLMPSQVVKGGAFDGTMNGPFGHGYGEGAGEGIDDVEWVVGKDKPTYDEIFYTLSPVNGKITGANAKKEMVKSKLPNTVLGKIWKLADVDKDGLLDDEEFALANHLIKVKLEGHELPADLPPHLVPPSKRRHE